MEQIQQQLALLTKSFGDAKQKLQLDAKQAELTDLVRRSNEPDFWQTTENNEAQAISQKVSQLQTLLSPWNQIGATIAEIGEFATLEDESLLADLEQKLAKADQLFESLKKDLRYSGGYDLSSVVMTIQAGAGGLDAQDWTQMLEKMYLKWAEKNNITTKILSQNYADEGGLKSSSITFEGAYAYGKLKSENGVHRLVRLSPFNSGGTRETSFAMVETIPQIDAPEDFVLDESDLRIDVYRAGGSGGQSVNTTDSAVRITHEPTGTVVSIQNERSQSQNKETALKVLTSRLASLAREQHKETIEGLRGPSQENSWGSQIRSYVLHPYTMVKDGRSGFSTTDTAAVLDGDINPLIESYLESTLSVE